MPAVNRELSLSNLFLIGATSLVVTGAAAFYLKGDLEAIRNARQVRIEASDRYHEVVFDAEAADWVLTEDEVSVLNQAREEREAAFQREYEVLDGRLPQRGIALGGGLASGVVGVFTSGRAWQIARGRRKER